MTTNTQIYKVGDKVRITGLSIFDRDEIGREGVVKRVDVLLYVGGYGLSVIIDGRSRLYRYTDVEHAKQKPTKNQRITTLEQQVAELQAQVATLKQAEKPTVTTIMDVVARYNAKSPNEQRKAIIAEAKAFVEDALNRNYGTGSTPKIKKTIESVWFTNECAGGITDKADFVVNAKKRTVVALIRTLNGKLVHKAIAKCAPDDVFNADIGKAIALGRALGLDVSRFEQAVKPTEVVVGQIVEDIDDDLPIAHGKVTRIEREDCFGPRGYDTEEGYAYLSHAKILDDTEAKY